MSLHTHRWDLSLYYKHFWAFILSLQTHFPVFEPSYTFLRSIYAFTYIFESHFCLHQSVTYRYREFFTFLVVSEPVLENIARIANAVPCHSLFKDHNVIVYIVVHNCQKCNQCQVSGHKSSHYCHHCHSYWGCWGW